MRCLIKNEDRVLVCKNFRTLDMEDYSMGANIKAGKCVVKKSGIKYSRVLVRKNRKCEFYDETEIDLKAK